MNFNLVDSKNQAIFKINTSLMKRKSIKLIIICAASQKEKDLHKKQKYIEIQI